MFSWVKNLNKPVFMTLDLSSNSREDIDFSGYREDIVSTRLIKILPGCKRLAGLFDVQ
jgi:hypothetical protein